MCRKIILEKNNYSRIFTILEQLNSHSRTKGGTFHREVLYIYINIIRCFLLFLKFAMQSLKNKIPYAHPTTVLVKIYKIKVSIYLKWSTTNILFSNYPAYGQIFKQGGEELFFPILSKFILSVLTRQMFSTNLFHRK